VGIIVLLLTITWLLWGVTVFSMTLGSLVLALAAFAVALFAPALRWLFPQEEAQNYMLKSAIALAGYTLAKIHLKWINGRFLKHGRISRLLSL
jgi:hypothetical protein